MSSNGSKKFIQTIDRVDDLVGADIPRNLLRVAVVAQDAEQLSNNIAQVNGTTQTADDWTPYFAELSAIADALKSNDADELVARIAGSDGVEIADGALDTTPGVSDVALVTAVAQALNDVGQDELVSRITDSAGTQVDPATNDDQPNYLNDTFLGHDLVGTGDYTLAETNVRGCGTAVIKIDSDEGHTFTVSTEWTDGAGNTVFEDKPVEATTTTRAKLSFGVASNHIKVTVTDESGESSNNVSGGINVH